MTTLIIIGLVLIFVCATVLRKLFSDDKPWQHYSWGKKMDVIFVAVLLSVGVVIVFYGVLL